MNKILGSPARVMRPELGKRCVATFPQPAARRLFPPASAVNRRAFANGHRACIAAKSSAALITAGLAHLAGAPYSGLCSRARV